LSAQQITLPSITGVDVRLQIAGPGSRSYAFIIDWHVRFIMALAWFFGATLLYTGSIAILRGAGGGYEHFFWIVVLPALGIYLLYHPILEAAMQGRTPGKRMAGVRIVTRGGDIPGPGALLLRNVFRLIDALPMFYVVGLASVILTAQHVRIGDLAAGTLLVLDQPESETTFASLNGATLNARAADLAQELLDRWPALDETTRADIARSLLVRLEPEAAVHIASESGARLHERLQRLLATGAAA
jgi:uncharacterized RDD family membrane protein YckC